MSNLLETPNLIWFEIQVLAMCAMKNKLLFNLTIVIYTLQHLTNIARERPHYVLKKVPLILNSRPRTCPVVVQTTLEKCLSRHENLVSYITSIMHSHTCRIFQTMWIRRAGRAAHFGILDSIYIIGGAAGNAKGMRFVNCHSLWLDIDSFLGIGACLSTWLFLQ